MRLSLPFIIVKTESIQPRLRHPTVEGNSHGRNPKTGKRFCLRHGALLQRMGCHLPMWKLYIYNEFGGWWAVEVTLPWGPSNPNLPNVPGIRLKWPWKSNSLERKVK